MDLEIIYKAVPLSEDYKNDKNNYCFYVNPIINIMSKCLKDIELPCYEFDNIIYYNNYYILLTKIAISCFWIINKYEDDYPLTYKELRKGSCVIYKNELELLEAWVLKKIDYRISPYITNMYGPTPDKLNIHNDNGIPILYVKPRL